MARIYSWFLKGDKYAYISNPTKGKEKEAYVGDKLSSGDTQIVSEWASNASEDEYRHNFEDMKQKTSSYGVKFESVEAYLNVVQGCTNLRGPRGRSLNKIEPGGEVTNDNGTFITYWVTFDDGAQDYFLMPKPKDGADGKPGATGAKADSPIASRVVFAYRSGVDKDGNILSEVPTPTGGKWVVETNTVEYPEGWFANDGELAPPIWMSTRTFASTQASTDLKWSKPQQITGENGMPGEDGANMEFIYLRQNVKPSTPQVSENTPNYVPNDWSDSPMGVDEENTTEWYSVRTYNKQTKTWGAWGTVNIWSKYGMNGQDGDGVQYIFLLNNGQLPLNPTPATWETDENYQNKDSEWLPEGIYFNINGEEVRQTPDDPDLSGNTPNRWYDNSPSVNIDNQYLWMSQRKYRIDTTTNKKQWGPYTDPSLWAKFGADGAPGTNATSIRRLYALSTSTSNPPELPGNSLYTGDWGTGYPKDYEAGVNVVWCTEAEVWAHNYAFVERYILVSITDDAGTVHAPTDADYNNNTLEVIEIPEEKIDGFKYLKLIEGNNVVGYYEWKSGWSAPFIVSGLKGNDVNPIDYTTYVFGYGWVDSTPEKPNGTTPENPGTSFDKNGRSINWMDYPDVSEGIDNSERRWYQCIGSVDGRNGAIKEWGNVFPCNGADGVGSYMEFRFGVTNDNKKPLVSVFDNNPELIVEGEKTGWFGTDEMLPDVPAGGAMWQIWGLIDGKTGTLVSGNKWNGPIKISGEKGETGLQGPAGLRGVTGIPGAKIETMYCLGTMDQPFADLGNAGTDMDIPPHYKSVMETMNWFNGKEMPYTDIIDVQGVKNLPDSASKVKYGHVYRVIDNVDDKTSHSTYKKTYHTYYLALGNNNYETAYRNRTSADTIVLTTLPNFKIDENEVKYIVTDETYYKWDESELNYKEDKIHSDSTTGNTIYMNDVPSSKIDTKNIQFIIVGNKRYVWDLSSTPNRYIETIGKLNGEPYNKEIITKDENVLYYRLLRGPILKDEVYDIYIWCTQGSEKYGVANRESYTAYKPINVTKNNTITINSDNLPTFKIDNNTLFRKGVKYYKYKSESVTYEVTDEISGKKYVVVNELPTTSPTNTTYIEHYDENRVMGYYTWDDNKGEYTCVTPDNTEDNTYSGNTIPFTNNVEKQYFELVRNNKTIGYFIWTTNDGDNVSHSLLGIDWGIPFKLQGTNGLRGIAGNRGQVVYPMGVYNATEIYLTNEAKAPYVYDPGDSLFYVYNIVGEPWVGLLPGYIINSSNQGEYLTHGDNKQRINSGLYKTYVTHPEDATSANTLEEIITTGVTADIYTYTGSNDKIKNKKYIKLKQKITHIIDVRVLEYDSKDNSATGTSTGKTEFTYDVDVYFKIEDNNVCNLASKYKYSKTGNAFDNQWMTDQDGITPATNYANSVEDGYEPAWVRFESFQALFANVGIIANGLIGSAVFNNEFMFSQQGKNRTKTKKSTNYQDFLSAYYYDEDGLVEVTSDNLSSRYCPKSKVKPGEIILRERHWCYADPTTINSGEKAPFMPTIEIDDEQLKGDDYGKIFKSLYFSDGRIDPYMTINGLKSRFDVYLNIEEFKDDYGYATRYTNEYIEKLANVIGIDTEDENSGNTIIHNFVPNICINFSTGQFWANTGGVQIGSGVDDEDTTLDKNTQQEAIDNYYAELTAQTENLSSGISEVLKKTEEVQNTINEFSADGWVSPEEQKRLKEELIRVEKEFEEWSGITETVRISDSGITTNYILAFKAAKFALTIYSKQIYNNNDHDLKIEGEEITSTNATHIYYRDNGTLVRIYNGNTDDTNNTYKSIKNDVDVYNIKGKKFIIQYKENVFKEITNLYNCINDYYIAFIALQNAVNESLKSYSDIAIENAKNAQEKVDSFDDDGWVTKKEQTELGKELERIEKEYEAWSSVSVNDINVVNNYFKAYISATLSLHIYSNKSQFNPYFSELYFNNIIITNRDEETIEGQFRVDDLLEIENFYTVINENENPSPIYNEENGWFITDGNTKYLQNESYYNIYVRTSDNGKTWKKITNLYNCINDYYTAFITLQNALNESLESASNMAINNANLAINRINTVGDDGWVTPTEQKQLKEELSRIQKEYEVWSGVSVNAEVSVNEEYINAFRCAELALTIYSGSEFKTPSKGYLYFYNENTGYINIPKDVVINSLLYKVENDNFIPILDDNDTSSHYNYLRSDGVIVLHYGNIYDNFYVRGVIPGAGTKITNLYECINNYYNEFIKLQKAYSDKSANEISNYAYLKKAFSNGSTEMAGGLILSEFMGVAKPGTDNQNLVAFMNGSEDENLTLYDNKNEQVIITAGYGIPTSGDIECEKYVYNYTNSQSSITEYYAFSEEYDTIIKCNKDWKPTTDYLSGSYKKVNGNIIINNEIELTPVSDKSTTYINPNFFARTKILSNGDIITHGDITTATLINKTGNDNDDDGSTLYNTKIKDSDFINGAISGSLLNNVSIINNKLNISDTDIEMISSTPDRSITIGACSAYYENANGDNSGKWYTKTITNTIEVKSGETINFTNVEYKFDFSNSKRGAVTFNPSVTYTINSKSRTNDSVSANVGADAWKQLFVKVSPHSDYKDGIIVTADTIFTVTITINFWLPTYKSWVQPKRANCTINSAYSSAVKIKGVYVNECFKIGSNGIFYKQGNTEFKLGGDGVYLKFNNEMLFQKP